MNYSTDQLKEKIRGFHPELAQNGVSLSVDWDAAGKRFALKLGKAGKEVGAYLDQKDADECMSRQEVPQPGGAGNPVTGRPGRFDHPAPAGLSCPGGPACPGSAPAGSQAGPFKSRGKRPA